MIMSAFGHDAGPIVHVPGQIGHHAWHSAPRGMSITPFSQKRVLNEQLQSKGPQGLYIAPPWHHAADFTCPSKDTVGTVDFGRGKQHAEYPLLLHAQNGPIRMPLTL